MSERCFGGCGRPGVVPQWVKTNAEDDYTRIVWCEPCATLVINRYLESRP